MEVTTMGIMFNNSSNQQASSSLSPQAINESNLMVILGGVILGVYAIDKLKDVANSLKDKIDSKKKPDVEYFDDKKYIEDSYEFLSDKDYKELKSDLDKVYKLLKSAYKQYVKDDYKKCIEYEDDVHEDFRVSKKSCQYTYAGHSIVMNLRPLRSKDNSGLDDSINDHYQLMEKITSDVNASMKKLNIKNNIKVEFDGYGWDGVIMVSYITNLPVKKGSVKEFVQSLNEVYFGKTKSLQAIENAMDAFRNKYMGKYFEMRINQDSDLLAINRMFEREFGFGTFSLKIENSMSINTFTLPIDTRFDVKTFGKDKQLLVDRTGFRFNPDMDYACMVYVYSGLMFNPNYSTDEIMAIILHEIGHNFFSSINTNNCILLLSYKVLLFIAILQSNILQFLFMSNTIDSAILKFERDLIQKHSIFIEIRDAFKWCNAILQAVIGGAFTIANLLTFNFLKTALYAMSAARKIATKVQNPLTLLPFLTSYRNERTADNFPAMYGYAPAASSAFKKMESAGYSASKAMNTIETIPFVSTIYNMLPTPFIILLTAFDEHPQGIARMSDQIDLLEHELRKTDLDHKMRKVIETDIKAIKQQIIAITDTSKGFKDPDLAKHIYNRILYDLTDDKAFKDMLFDERRKFEQYDKVFYQQLDAKK